MTFLKNSIIPLFILLFLASCKEEQKKHIALPETPAAVVKEKPTTFYVIAPSGLVLRNGASLDAPQVAKMPYAAQVKIEKDSAGGMINVANIDGHMTFVRFGSETGFAFDGYLSQFPVPKNGENAEAYSIRLKGDFTELAFADLPAGQAGAQQSTTISKFNTLNLPARSWAEAYLLAQHLFKIPKDYIFPGMSGREQQTIKQRVANKSLNSTNLKVARDNNALTGIAYTETGKSFARQVLIKKENELFLITEQTTAD